MSSVCLGLVTYNHFNQQTDCRRLRFLCYLNSYKWVPFVISHQYSTLLCYYEGKSLTVCFPSCKVYQYYKPRPGRQRVRHWLTTCIHFARCTDEWPAIMGSMNSWRENMPARDVILPFLHAAAAAITLYARTASRQWDLFSISIASGDAERQGFIRREGGFGRSCR